MPEKPTAARLAAQLAEAQDERARVGATLADLRQQLDQLRYAFADLAEAYDVLAAVNALHQPHTNSIGHDWCKACSALWPCRTSKAIEGTVPVPGSSRRAQEPVDPWPIEPVPGEHYWVSGRLTSCRWCGIVRRYDSANKPCKGRVHVELRPAAAGESQASEPAERLAATEPTRPRIVVLCGSTRFMDTFMEVNAALTLEGAIVLSVAVVKNGPASHWGESLGPDVVERLDELHKRKIDLADEVYVLNVGGYVGDSTRSEIEYAQRHGKSIRWLESAPVAPKLAQGGRRSGCGPDCSEGHTYEAGCAVKPPARAFLGEKPCGKPGCPCGGAQ